MWSKGDHIILVNPWDGCPLPAGSTAIITLVMDNDTVRLKWDCETPWTFDTLFGGLTGWAEKAGGPW